MMCIQFVFIFLQYRRNEAKGNDSAVVGINVAAAKPASNYSTAPEGKFQPASPFGVAMKAGFLTIKFERRCDLYHEEGASTERTWILLAKDVVLKMVFDTAMRFYRIIAQDGMNHQCLCNTIICIKTEMKVNDPFLLLYISSIKGYCCSGIIGG